MAGRPAFGGLRLLTTETVEQALDREGGRRQQGAEGRASAARLSSCCAAVRAVHWVARRERGVRPQMLAFSTDPRGPPARVFGLWTGQRRGQDVRPFAEVGAGRKGELRALDRAIAVSDTNWRTSAGGGPGRCDGGLRVLTRSQPRRQWCREAIEVAKKFGSEERALINGILEDVRPAGDRGGCGWGGRERPAARGSPEIGPLCGCGYGWPAAAAGLPPPGAWWPSRPSRTARRAPRSSSG